jgi:hypothetical protein
MDLLDVADRRRLPIRQKNSITLIHQDQGGSYFSFLAGGLGTGMVLDSETDSC